MKKWGSWWLHNGFWGTFFFPESHWYGMCQKGSCDHGWWVLQPWDIQTGCSLCFGLLPNQPGPSWIILNHHSWYLHQISLWPLKSTWKHLTTFPTFPTFPTFTATATPTPTPPTAPTPTPPPPTPPPTPPTPPTPPITATPSYYSYYSSTSHTTTPTTSMFLPHKIRIDVLKFHDFLSCLPYLSCLICLW